MALPKRPLTEEQKQLAEQWLPLAMRLAGKATKHFANIDPQEIHSMAYDALLHAVSTFRPARGVPIRNWLGWAVYRLIMNGIRDYRASRRLESEWPVDVEGELIVIAELGREQRSMVAEREIVDDLRRKLDPKYFAVLECRQAYDVKREDIARFLGVSPVRVGQIEQKALAAARRRINRHAA